MYSVCVYRRPDNSLGVGFVLKQSNDNSNNRIVSNYVDDKGYGGLFQVVNVNNLCGDVVVYEPVNTTSFGV